MVASLARAKRRYKVPSPAVHSGNISMVYADNDRVARVSAGAIGMAPLRRVGNAMSVTHQRNSRPELRRGSWPTASIAPISIITTCRAGWRSIIRCSGTRRAPALGAVPERGLPPGAAGARSSQSGGGADGGLRSRQCRRRRDPVIPQPDRILFHVFAGLDSVRAGKQPGCGVGHLSRQRPVLLCLARSDL